MAILNNSQGFKTQDDRNKFKDAIEAARKANWYKNQWTDANYQYTPQNSGHLMTQDLLNATKSNGGKFNLDNNANFANDFAKNWFDNANKYNADKKAWAEREAKGYYDTLGKLGYGDIADKLKTLNATDADKYVNKLQNTYGKTAARDTWRAMGAQYGLSPEDVDKQIKWDDATGEVWLGGVSAGIPDGIDYDELGNGTSYYDDESKVRNAFNDFAKKNNLQLTREYQYKQDQSDISNAIKNALNYIHNGNPYDSPVGQAIMAQYGAAGNTASQNAAASRAASNGGNIDSMAAQSATAARDRQLANGYGAVNDYYSRQINEMNNLINSWADKSHNASNDYTSDKIGDSQVRLNDANSYAIKSNADTEAANSLTARTGQASANDIRTKSPYYTNGKFDLQRYGGNYADFYNQYNSLANNLKSYVDIANDTTGKYTHDQKVEAAMRIKDYQNQMADLSVLSADMMAAMKENGTWTDAMDNAPHIPYIPYWSEAHNQALNSNLTDTMISKIGADAQKYVSNNDLAGIVNTNKAAVDQTNSTNATTMQVNRDNNNASLTETAMNNELTREISGATPNTVNSGYGNITQAELDKVANGINTKLGNNYLKKDTNGKYTFTQQQLREGAEEKIIAEVMGITGLTKAEKAEICLGLGCSQAQIDLYNKNHDE